MADSRNRPTEFEDAQGRKRLGPLCIACEELLADALDGSLSEVDQAWFDRHIAGCMDCSVMVADAQRGAAWLEMLKTPRPEPSANLLERILAQTSGQTSGQASAQTNGQLSGQKAEQDSPAAEPEFNPAVFGQPALLPVANPYAPVIATGGRGNVLAFRPRMPRFASWQHAMFEPRLAMTAAMAFFSVALTLNLTGVRLDQLKASDLSAQGLKRTYYAANADAVRYCDNLRVVRVMESKVDDLRQAQPETNKRLEQQPETTPQEAPQPKDRGGKPNAAPAGEKDPSKPDGGVSERTTSADRPRVLMTQQTLQRNDQDSASSTHSSRKGGLA